MSEMCYLWEILGCSPSLPTHYGPGVIIHLMYNMATLFPHAQSPEALGHCCGVDIHNHLEELALRKRLCLLVGCGGVGIHVQARGWGQNPVGSGADSWGSNDKVMK